jgi:hypothetical protein
MRPIRNIVILFVCSILSNMVAAQQTWLWAESIDRSNTWNDPFYKQYNSIDKLMPSKGDSANSCTDCSLVTILWNGLESNKITPYQLDKKSKLSIQKFTQIKSTLLSQINGLNPIESVQDLFSLCEVTIYRRADTSNTDAISAMPVEWLALNIQFERDTFSLYLKSKECFTYLNYSVCRWVHPVNQHIKLSITNALMQRQYIIGKFDIVSAANLHTAAIYKSKLPPLAEKLKKSDTNASKNKIEYKKDTLLVRLQAVYSADIREQPNRGFNKAHIIEYLLKLHAENKIKGYTYHEGGYFSAIQTEGFYKNLITFTFEDGELSFSRAPLSALTRLHVLKTYTKISNGSRISADWLIVGLSKDVSVTFNNTYAIAFKFEDVLSALSATNLMWYHGKNQQDSMRLDMAFRKEYIAYNEMAVYAANGNPVMSRTKQSDTYSEVISTDPVSALLYEYTSSIRADFDASQKKMSEQKNNVQTTTYQLNYFFTSESNSELTKNTLLTDALLDGIRSNSIKVYRDKHLKMETTSVFVLNKLDKTRFYQTGNRKKDSIYISKIPLEKRFIKAAELTEFTVCSRYTTIKKKSINQGFSLGVFIPADLNPQYETDTLCYVSFSEFVSFLQKNKAYKKLSAPFVSVLNEKAIVSVEDFYDLLIYDAAVERAAIPDDLPVFVRERIKE